MIWCSRRLATSPSQRPLSRLAVSTSSTTPADLSEARHHRDIEALSGVALHVFNFALSLRPERPVQARCEAHFFGELSEEMMEVMLTC